MVQRSVEGGYETDFCSIAKDFLNNSATTGVPYIERTRGVLCAKLRVVLA
jgi:hypothetical protein